MKKNSRINFAASMLMLLFVGAFLLIAGRFIYIQATGEANNVSLNEWAQEKRTTSYALQAERGKIYDSNKMTLAYDRPVYKLFAIVSDEYTLKEDQPEHVVDVEKTAEHLASHLDVDKSYIQDRLEAGIKNERFQVEFGKYGSDLDQKKKEEIEALDLPGINFEKESMRYYPNGVFASHIIGFARKQEEDKPVNDEVDNENDETETTDAEDKESEEEEADTDSEQDDTSEEQIVGVTGMEKVMNDILKGEDGFISYQRDRFNKKLLNPDEIVKKPVDGKDIYLTIDQKIQILLEDVMTEVEEDYDPERVTAVVMDAKTGEVLAMSNRPSYNPNSPQNVKNWYNDVISTPFEPGSTVKMFTWAAAIDAGVYNGEEWFQSGKYQINERVEPINDHNKGQGWGSITFDEGFERSSNVAASKLAWEKLGPEKFLEYLKAFDLDKKTEIDLPGEVAGKILYDWPAEKLTTSFGQGSTVTPIQQVKAATAIANGGEMLKPYVIKKIVDSNTDEVIEENNRTVVSKPISEKTANKMIDLLDSVVNGEHGTGKPYKLDDYTVIGKTGTAQIPNNDGGTAYLSGKNNNIFAFLGMAPKDDPELIMYVAVKQPKLKETETGSVPVSFIFKNVMENSLHYLNITPDKKNSDKVDLIKIPSLDKDVATVEEALTDLGLRVSVIGDGKEVSASSVKEGESVLANEHIILVTDKPKMPNITGWSLRDVQQLSNLIELDLETIGNGYVTTQSIKKDTPLKENDYLGIELEEPGKAKKEKK